MPAASAAFVIASASFFLGLTEPSARANGDRIAMRFAGISSNLRFPFFDLLNGRSMRERPSLISDQSSRLTSSRRRPVKAEMAKNGTQSAVRVEGTEKFCHFSRSQDLDLATVFGRIVESLNPFKWAGIKQVPFPG